MDTKKTIMVVDDNPDIITIVRTILEGKGYNVMSAYSGAELLSTLEKDKPDLVVLDIMMPVLDGWFVLAELGGRATRPSVVVCSAKSGDSDRARAHELGADEYVTKPFEPDDLVLVIRDVLARASAQVS
jgi:DNA-binding response OmpR family regulator